MQLKFIKIVTILLIINWLFISVSYAQMSDKMPITMDEINRQPWQSYIKLQKFEQEHGMLTGEEYLQFLLLKAQTENLLYFYKKLNKTIALAIDLISSETPAEISGEFYIYAGLKAQREGQYERSILLLTHAINLAKEHDLSRIYILAKNELAYTRSLFGFYETSLNDIQQAYVDAYALHDQFLIAIINETYGAIYGYLKEYEKSIDYYEKARQTYEALSYKAHLAEAIYGMAATYRYWKKYDLAIEKFNLYIDKLTYSPNSEISYFGHYGLGMTYAEQGNCTKALKIIDQALLLHGPKDYDAELHKRKAECLLKLGKIEEAEQENNKAIEIFSSIPELDGTRWQLEVEKIAAAVAHALGDDNQAYLLMLKYHNRFTALIEKNASERLLKVRTMLEIERNNTEIALLKQRAKVQTLLTENQQQQIKQQYYLVAFVVFVTVVLLIFLLIQQGYTRKVLAVSIRDSLSGLYNRKYIFEFLDKIVETTISEQGELSVILLDIDDFKLVNDEHGHPFGDEVIREISTICQESHRKDDIVGRIGGEEFFCILPSADLDETKRIAQRILNNIAEHIFTTASGEPYSVTVSIGIACINIGAQTSIDLYTQADKALYYAKKLGKNNIVAYQDIKDKINNH